MACGRRCPAPAIAPPEPTLMATVNRTWPSNTGQGVSILLGTGSAKAPFTAGQSLTLSNAGCLLAADLNGDHIPDLWCLNQTPWMPTSTTAMAPSRPTTPPRACRGGRGGLWGGGGLCRGWGGGRE